MELVDSFSFCKILPWFPAGVRIINLFDLIHESIIVSATTKLRIKIFLHEIF